MGRSLAMMVIKEYLTNQHRSVRYKYNAFKYPKRAAKFILYIPGAEVDVERLFSEGRDILGIRRQLMDRATMRIIAFLKAYWHQILMKEKAQEKEKEAHH
jgi:hypothetical protein